MNRSRPQEYVRSVLLTATGAILMASPLALAQTSTTSAPTTNPVPTTGVLTTSVISTPPGVLNAAAAGAPTAQQATPQTASPCADQESRVAVFANGRRGSEIVVHRAASPTSAPIAKLRTGINSFGQVVFRILADEGSYWKVLSPSRPNGSTGYVRKDQVSTFTTPFRIDISLSKRTLTTYRCGTQILAARVAVGKSKTPTPTGSFFLVDLIKPRQGPRGPYGPYAFGLSGFSNVLQSFGAGDGRVGIHGTNQPAKIGTAASSGCIRVDNATITKLAKTLYLGTPVNITP